MDVQAALKDIDEVMRTRKATSRHDLLTVSAILHACICRYAPPSSTYRQLADAYIGISGMKPPGELGIMHPDDSLRAVLRGMRRDVEAEKLHLFEERVRADVYGDLLAQADGLHSDRYSRAATVIAGAALEDHLKKLAVKHGTGTTITSGKHTGEPKKASAINNGLKAANVYGETQRANVEGWQKLRNDAAHGNPGFEGQATQLVGQVKPMIDGTRAFISQYPA